MGLANDKITKLDKFIHALWTLHPEGDPSKSELPRRSSQATLEGEKPNT